MRRVRAFGVGIAKTGTHSLAAMFAGQARCLHEADSHLLIETYLNFVRCGEDGPLRHLLMLRDAARRLHLDVSHLNLYLLRWLDELFPDSRYVLTIRRPDHWLRSILDDSLGRSVSDTWKRFKEYRFGNHGGYSDCEKKLEAAGLYPIDAYLTYWRNGITRVRNTIPSDRLLVVRTDELSSRASEVAEFCGLPEPDTSGGKAHSFPTPKRFDVLEQIGEDFAREALVRICGPLSAELFPEVDLEKSFSKPRRRRKQVAAV